MICILCERNQDKNRGKNSCLEGSLSIGSPPTNFYAIEYKDLYSSCSTFLSTGCSLQQSRLPPSWPTFTLFLVQGEGLNRTSILGDWLKNTYSCLFYLR